MFNKSISIGIICLLIISGLLGLLQVTSINASATFVSGTVYDGNGGPWTVAGSPYIVIDVVTVPVGETLTIEPGVEVKFQGMLGIVVDGTLYSVGNKTNRINITTNIGSPTPPAWVYIHISTTGHLELQYTDISYAMAGIEIHSSNNNITNNSFSNNGYGILLDSSSYNNITGNYFYNDGVVLEGNQLQHFNSHTILDNIVNGKPLYYYKDTNGIDVDGVPVGQLLVANCTNVNVRNLQIFDTDMALLTAYCSNVQIFSNNITSIFAYPYYSRSSTYIDMSNNIISNNRHFGIFFETSSKSNLTNNTISSNGYIGIWLEISNYNNVLDNIISSNDDDGILLRASSNNNVLRNNISDNGANGVRADAGNNKIYHNNIINNVDPAYDTSSMNIWNDTYPSGGNYWSHWSPTHDDLFNGEPTPQTTGSPDGICDDPYFIDADSVDYHPLKYPYPTPLPPPDLEPPIIENINTIPDPQEVDDHVNISAEVTDNNQLDGVWIEIIDPIGGNVGNFSMDYNLATSQYYRNDTFNLLGTYQFTIWACDKSSNWNFSSGSFVIEDRKTPLIENVTSDPAIQVIFGNVNISAIITDNYQLSEVWINVTGYNNFWINNTMEEGISFEFYLNRSYNQIGIYNYTIYARDSSDNWNLVVGSFGIQDVSLPTATAEIDGSYWKNTTIISVLWTGSDNIGLSNITLLYRFSNNNVSWGPWIEYSYNNSVSGTSANGSFEFIALADGYYEFFINASDTENNWESDPLIAEAIAAVDTKAPFSSIGIEPYWQTSSTLMVNIQTGDSNPSSGIKEYTRFYRFSLDNLSWSPWEKYEGDIRDGYYEFYGIAEDNAGNVESKSTIDAMYALDNTPPVANAGEDKVIEPGTEVILNGTGSSDNFGMISNYTWLITKDSIQITTLYGPNNLFEIVSVGNYVVNLTVTDQLDHTDYDTVLIQVIMDSEPPQIVHLPNPVDQEIFGHVNITASVSDNEEVEEVWIVVSDPNENELWNLSMSRIGLTDEYWHEDFYSILGTFSYFVWAKDSSLNWNVSQGSFVMQDTTEPSADAGEDLTIDVNDTVDFNASQSTDNHGIVNYSWNIFKNGNLVVNLYGINPSNKFVENGTYEVILTVKDSSGNAKIDTVIVTVRAPDSTFIPKKDPEESSNIWLLIPIMVIVIAFILFIVLRKRQGKEPEEEISDGQVSQQSENGGEDPSDPIDEKELPEEEDILPTKDDEAFVE